MYVKRERPPEIRYHRDIGFPKDVKIPDSGMWSLNYGNNPDSHSRKASTDDRYGHINLPKAIKLEDCEVIEIGVDADRRRLNKLLVRIEHDPEYDLCIVFQPYNGFVRTVWLNHKDDTHQTLDESKYAKV